MSTYKNRVVAIVVATWFTCAALSSGFMNAYFRGEYPELLQSPRWAGTHRNQSIMYGIVTGPMGLIISGLAGGFYDGWTLRGDSVPCTTDHPDIWCKP